MTRLSLRSLWPFNLFRLLQLLMLMPSRPGGIHVVPLLKLVKGLADLLPHFPGGNQILRTDYRPGRRSKDGRFIWLSVANRSDSKIPQKTPIFCKKSHADIKWVKTLYKSDFIQYWCLIQANKGGNTNFGDNKQKISIRKIFKKKNIWNKRFKKKIVFFFCCCWIKGENQWNKKIMSQFLSLSDQHNIQNMTMNKEFPLNF